MSESLFTGPGEVLLAPEIWGDIVPIQVDGNSPWSLGKDAFLAATHEIKLTTKSQGFGKALCESMRENYLSRLTKSVQTQSLERVCLSPKRLEGVFCLFKAWAQWSRERLPHKSNG